jgi:hypothetical protein
MSAINRSRVEAFEASVLGLALFGSTVLCASSCVFPSFLVHRSGRHATGVFYYGWPIVFFTCDTSAASLGLEEGLPLTSAKANAIVAARPIWRALQGRKWFRSAYLAIDVASFTIAGGSYGTLLLWIMRRRSIGAVPIQFALRELCIMITLVCIVLVLWHYRVASIHIAALTVAVIAWYLSVRIALRGYPNSDVVVSSSAGPYWFLLAL